VPLRGRARLSGVLHAEDTPGAGQRVPQVASSLRSPWPISTPWRASAAAGAVRVALQAAQVEPGPLQSLQDRTTLLTCHSGDENRSIVCHGLSLSASLLSVPNYTPG